METKASIEKTGTDTEAKAKVLEGQMSNEAATQGKRLGMGIDHILKNAELEKKKDLQSSKKDV